MTGNHRVRTARAIYQQIRISDAEQRIAQAVDTSTTVEELIRLGWALDAARDRIIERLADAGLMYRR